MSEKSQDVLEAARRYLSRGDRPIPIPHGEKAPKIKNWTKRFLAEEELESHFPPGSNIGVLLGEPSNGLVDVDIDDDDAIPFAQDLLPKTEAIFGRERRPGTHRLYRCPSGPGKTIKLIDEDGKTLVEIRSTGAQTIFPPSTHPSGEIIAWETEGPPEEVIWDDLERAVRLVALATVVGRHYPAQGSRHDFCLILGSLLVRAGYEEGDIKHFLRALANAVGDEEARDRENAAASAEDRFASGGTAWGLPHLADLIGDEPTRAIAKILDLPFRKGEKEARRDRMHRDVRPRLDLWHTSDGITFASFDVDGHRETHRIQSKAFRHWLIRRAVDGEGKGIGKAAIDDLISMLEAEAIAGPMRRAELRVAEHDGDIFIDLGDEHWRAIQIGSGGWEIVTKPPVRFYRSGGMEALPEPERGGALDELREFVNVATDDDFLLLKGVLIGAFVPWGAHVIAVINGEQGTAKSTLVRIIRALVDPNRASTRAEPSSEDDMYVAAANSYFLSFDNISYLSGGLSDALCRIATGGGFSKRQLYTDQDEVILQVCRPILLNGIPDIVNRPDLMDRSIVFTLPRIRSSERRTERDLMDRFEAAQARVLGAICDAISAGLEHRNEVHLEELPRMGDLIVFMTAVERGMDWEEGEFARAYGESTKASMMDLAAADPLVEVIQKVLSDGSFKGTATELLRQIRQKLPDQEKYQRGMPRLPNALSGRLRRLAPALSEMGIEVVLDASRDDHNRKTIEIRWLEEPGF